MRNATAALVLATLAASAHADIVEMAFVGTGRGQNVHIAAGQTEMNVFAGQLLHNVTGGTGLGEQLLGANILYCTDVFEHATTQTSTFTVSALTEVPDSLPMSPAAAAAMAGMFAEADGAQFASDAPTAYAAAFQLAVWEVASDYDPQLGASSLDLSSGWFRASGYGQPDLPASVLDNVAGFFAAAARADQFDGWLFALRSDSYQDQLGARTVPTPGSTAAVTLGLILAIGRRRG